MIRGTGWHHRLQHMRESTNMTLKTQKHTYTHSLNLPQWYWGQQLLVLLRSTARISPCEHVGMGSIHDSHTTQTGNTSNTFSFVAVIVELSKMKTWQLASLTPKSSGVSFRLTCDLSWKTYHTGTSNNRVFPPWPPLGTDPLCSWGQTQEGMPWGHTLRKTSHSKVFSESKSSGQISL